MSLGMTLVLILTITMASFTQAVTGFGFSILAIPLLAIFMPVVDAIVIATISSFFLTAVVALRERHRINSSILLKVSVLSALGMPLGIVVLREIDERWIVIAIVCFVLVSTFASFGKRIVIPERIPVNGFLGFVSGSMLTSTGLNGPPIVLLVHRVETEAGRARALMQALFALQDFIAIIIFSISGMVSTESITMTSRGLVGLVLGWLVGNWLFHRIPGAVSRRIAVTALVLVSAYLGFRVVFL